MPDCSNNFYATQRAKIAHQMFVNVRYGANNAP